MVLTATNVRPLKWSCMPTMEQPSHRLHTFALAIMRTLSWAADDATGDAADPTPSRNIIDDCLASGLSLPSARGIAFKLEGTRSADPMHGFPHFLLEKAMIVSNLMPSGSVRKFNPGARTGTRLHSPAVQAITSAVYDLNPRSERQSFDRSFVWRPRVSACLDLSSSRPSDCLWSALLDIFHLCEEVGRFPSSFYYSYTTLIPKGVARTPLSLRPITVLPVPYRLYASLRCQTLLKWQDTWIHSSQFAFCKGRSTTSLNSHLSFDLLVRYQSHGCFAGLQFDFAKCFDSIPYSVVWSTLKHYGCDSSFVDLLSHLYTNFTLFPLCGMHRLLLVCYQWFITRGPFKCCYSQLSPLSFIINRLSTMEGLSVYAFADDLTVVSTSWDTLALAFAMLCQFSTSTDLRLNLSKCQLWNKGNPYGHYPPDFDQFTFCFIRFY